MSEQRGLFFDVPELNPKHLICVALRAEAKFLPDVFWGPFNETLITGIGRRNAEASLRKFFASKTTRRVFTCGFAGGLNPNLAVGTVVFETNDSVLCENLLFEGAKPAKFWCAARIATTSEEKRELRRTTGADAVEMESEVIHSICRERGIPCATVRAISDTASEDLPLDFNKLSKPDLSLDYVKLVLAIGKSPGKILALLRLQRNCKLAAQRLAAVLNEVIWPK